MISEGSCDTEDWSKDAEIQLCYHRDKYKIYYNKIHYRNNEHKNKKS